MILKIQCQNCRHDLVRRTNGGYLECMECDGGLFRAMHVNGDKVDEFRKDLKELKSTLSNTSNYDQVIKRLGTDFESLFK